MDRNRKKKQISPRPTPRRRPARLHSAAVWLKKYTGQNVLRAASMLPALSVWIGTVRRWNCSNPVCVSMRNTWNGGERTERMLAERRNPYCETQKQHSKNWYDHRSPLEAGLAEDHAALYDMECKSTHTEAHHGPPARTQEFFLPSC